MTKLELSKKLEGHFRKDGSVCGAISVMRRSIIPEAWVISYNSIATEGSFSSSYECIEFIKQFTRHLEKRRLIIVSIHLGDNIFNFKPWLALEVEDDNEKKT